ncbi:hypothetical protein JYU19_01980 [bacterium AH-315-J21]|nr:hypothetical protein [bacterium AH-315-J21]
MSVFRRSPEALLVHLNENGVAVYLRESQTSDGTKWKSFPASVSIEDALEKAALRIRKLHSNGAIPIHLILGGQFAHTVFEKSEFRSDVDIALTRQRGSRETICDVQLTKHSSANAQQVLRTVALDGDIIKIVVAILGGHGVEIVAVSSPAELVACLPDSLTDRTTSGFVSPFEYVALSRDPSGIPRVISDVGCFTKSDRTNLSVLADRVVKTIPLTDYLHSVVNQRNSWKHLLTRQPTNKLLSAVWQTRFRYAFGNAVARSARFALATSFLFLALGFWQSNVIEEASANTSHLRSLIDERDMLLEKQRMISAESRRNQIIDNLSSSALLGALGQRKVSHGHIESISIATKTKSSGEATISGSAENEAEVFGYLDFVRKQLPGFTVSLQTISEKRIRNRTQDTQSKQFTIKISH